MSIGTKSKPLSLILSNVKIYLYITVKTYVDKSGKFKIRVFDSPGICDCNTLLIAKLVRKSSAGEVAMRESVYFVN